jgi:hypothetical protein
MGDVGGLSRGYRLSLSGPRAVPFSSRAGGESANAIRGIAFGCAVSTLFWVGLGALVRAALG